MNSYFRLAGIFACLSAARAHEAWTPHSHMLDDQRSDVFVLSLGFLAAAGLGLLLFRLFRKRFKQELPNSLDQQPNRRSGGALSRLDHRAN